MPPPYFHIRSSMLIEKELIVQAKEKLGEKAILAIKEYFDIQNWDEKNSKGSCPFGHSDSSPSFIWNPKTLCFHCFSCGRNFGILDLYMKQGSTYLESVEKLFDEVGIKYKFGERGVRSKRDYNYPVVDCVEDMGIVQKYFESRHISKETLDYCKVGQDKSGNVVWKFFDENDTLLTVKLRHPRKPKPNEEKEWYLPGYDNTPILYNMQHADPSNGPLVITEGQIDTLAVIESGYLNVVSVPGGAQNNKWIEICYDWLNQFDQFIIFSDADTAGVKMRKEVVSRLGQWKCKYIEIPEEYTNENKEYKDANAILFAYGKQAVLNLINNAQEIPIEGIIDLSQADTFDIELAPGLYPGLKSVKDIVYKFLLGTVVVVTGLRGSGKSSLINQLFVCDPLQNGYDVFCYSGELSPSVLKNWISLTMASPEFVTMKDRFVHLIDKTAKTQMEDWYKERIWIYNQVSNKAKDVLDKAIAVTRKYGVKIWIIDNLTTLDLESGDDNINQKQKDFVVELNRLAMLYGVLVVLVVHPRKVQNGQELNSDDVGGSGAITNLAQYVLSVKRFTKKEKDGETDNKGNYRRGKEPIEEDVEINIMKNRFSGRIGTARLYFEYSSYRFFSTPSELYFRYKWYKGDPNKPIPKFDPRNAKLPEGMRD